MYKSIRFVNFEMKLGIGPVHALKAISLKMLVRHADRQKYKSTRLTKFPNPEGMGPEYFPDCITLKLINRKA